MGFSPSHCRSRPRHGAPALSKRSASNGSSSRRSLGEGGFTIVEVMMASVILVVGFMGMIQAVTIGSEMLATARRQTLATQILSHEMEKLRLTAWSSMPADSAGAAVSITIDSRFTNAIAACGLATADITLTRTTDDVATDLKEVTFEVIWQKGGTTTAASTTTGTWLERIAFQRETPIARTYTRRSTSWFTKYGLNHAAQRS